MEINFREFMQLQEIFNHLPSIAQVNPIWEPALDQKNKVDYKARFTVDGDEYIVGFSKVETINVDGFYVAWDLNRGALGWWGIIKSIFIGSYEYDRTGLAKTKGLGYTFTVLKSVISIIGEFVHIIRPAILSYDEHDEKLKRFYDHIANKIGFKAGYRPVGLHGGLLVRHDKLRNAAVMKAVQKHLVGEV